MDLINFPQQIRVTLLVVVVNHVLAIIFMISWGRVTLVEMISVGKVCLARFRGRAGGDMMVRTVVRGRVVEWLMCWLMVMVVGLWRWWWW